MPARREERPIDIKCLLARLRFASSAETPGLQMADIAVNAVRRMLSGNLGPAGWRKLGRVMVQPAGTSEAVHMLSLANRRRSWTRAPYLLPLRALRASALPMLQEDAVTPP